MERGMMNGTMELVARRTEENEHVQDEDETTGGKIWKIGPKIYEGREGGKKLGRYL